MHHDLVFKALADPTRRAILRLLRDGEMTAGDIAARFDISAPSMSHHFNVLKHADLIYARREGQQLYYALNTTVFQDVLTSLMEFFASHEVAHRTSDSGATK
jgi:ArsR family transcriptional regulator, arsenate/arsenite/antimonite-responsive transcriptional repressor